MKKAVVPLYFLLMLSAAAFSQNKVDSLLKIIDGSAADSNRVRAKIELAKIYRTSEPFKALEQSKGALELSQRSGFQSGEALAYKWIGFFYYDRGIYDTAAIHWESSLSTYRNIQDFDGMSNMLNNLGSISYNSGNNAKALSYFMEALEAGEKSGNTLRIITSTNNIGLIYMGKPVTYAQALVYLRKSLEVATLMKDTDNIGTAHANIGEVNLNLGNDSLARFHFLKAKEVLEPDGSTLPYVLLSMGRLHQKRKEYTEAQKWFKDSYNTATRLNNPLFKSDAALGIAETYRLLGYPKEALKFFAESKALAEDAQTMQQLKMSFKGLANTYGDLQNYRLAYLNERSYSTLSDSLASFNTDSLQKKFELGEKDKDIALLNADRKLKEQAIKKEKLVRNAFLAGFALVLALIGILYRDYKNKIKTNRLLDQRKAEIEALLLNILPFEVAAELQKTGKSQPRYYESTTVMFTDFVGFSAIAEKLTPQEVTAELNEFFTEMDEIIDKYGLEKIKTIGDSYMCAGGIPTANNTHPVDAVRAGLEIVDYLQRKNKARDEAGLPKWEIRIGINTGSLVAGVVGKKKYAYDIWGSTVNIASRMESNGQPGMLNISASTYEYVKDRFECEYRGKIYAKNVGEIDMYFVKRELKEGELATQSGETALAES